LEKKSRYDNLSTMTKKDLEEELNFYTFLDELVDITISQEMKLRNKMWLDSVWIEIKDRGYTWSKVYKLEKAYTNENQ
tara:strand:+ start:543 stop:776 length:234 start_codon:yes stop_codon:yes gene_type:complete